MKSALALAILFVTPVALSSADDLAITTTSALYNGTVDVPYVFLRFQASGGAGGCTWDAPCTAPPPRLTQDSPRIHSPVPTPTGANPFSVRRANSQCNQPNCPLTRHPFHSP